MISKAKACAEKGEDVIIAGDLNLKVGNKKSGLVGNDEVVSKGGNVLLDAIEEAEIEICNSLHTGGLGRTHRDATSKTERTLDLVMSNVKDKFSWLEVDEDDFTLYRVRLVKGKAPSQVFTDHKSVLWEFETIANTRMKRPKRLTTWRYGKPGSREAFYRATDEISYEVGEWVREVKDINEVMRMID